MSERPPNATRTDRRARPGWVVELLVHVALSTAIVVAIVTVAALASGRGALAVKNATFVLGILAAGVGSLLLRPRAAWTDRSRLDAIRREGRGPIGRVAVRAVPTRWRLPDELAPTTGGTLTAIGVALLAISFLAERLFGVA